MANAWLTHVKSEMKKHKGKKFKEILKLAKKTYRKSAKSSTPTGAKTKRKRRRRRRKSKGKRTAKKSKKRRRRRRKK